MIYRKKKGIPNWIIKPILLVLPVFLVFSIIWLRSNLVALEYELGQLQLQRANLIKEERELVAKRAEMASVKKIEYIASKKMGFVYPDRKRVFFVKIDYAPGPYTAGLTTRSKSSTASNRPSGSK